MSALDANAILLQYANVYVGDDAASVVDLGSVRNVKFTAQQNRTKVNSDNRGTILNKNRLNGMVEFEWLEAGDASKLETMFKGLITKTTVAGSIVSGASQVVASASWNYENLIFIENQNNDLSEIVINSVTLGTNGAIVEGTDYFKVKDPATGKWGIIIYDSLTVTTISQTVTINYDYTPAASQVLTGGTSQSATNRYVKLVGPDEDDANKERIIILEEAVTISDLLLPFVNVDDAGDVGVMPVQMESNKASTWTYTDEINAS